ncbi:MAG: gamma-glutamyl-gamma-aminobutyrate hydrolase family protein [Candidatus Riflebacteria bacterium]|nr:gamma-glutamyl-gamma-aminobutyrate hydrolase family protein [Candidatus Riflebacteria bacterium]
MTYSDLPERDEQMKVRTYCGRKYYVALQNAGLDVILIPPHYQTDSVKRLLSLIDGLLLPGGEDIDPRFQGDDPHPALDMVNPLRDEFEIEIAKLAYEKKIPTLGICRGAQLMTVALGGSLYQDLPSCGKFIQHRQHGPRWGTCHKVTFDDNSALKNWFSKSEFYVNSFHHQGIKSIPDCFSIAALSPDGLIEAVEATDNRIFVGVQWHPEELVDHSEFAAQLFQSFAQKIA